jgi:hypothetical protein
MPLNWQAYPSNASAPQSHAKSPSSQVQVFKVRNRSPGQERVSRKPIGVAASRFQRCQEALPVLVVPEDRFPLILTLHHVVNRPEDI